MPEVKRALACSKLWYCDNSVSVVSVHFRLNLPHAFSVLNASVFSRMYTYPACIKTHSLLC